jgi:hypothetical protein
MIALALAVAVLTGGPSPAPKPTPTPTPEPISVISDAAHDGSDTDHAIVVHAPTEIAGETAIFRYMATQRCGTGLLWILDELSTISQTDHTYDQLDMHCSDGSALRTFYFDVTDFIDKK